MGTAGLGCAAGRGSVQGARAIDELAPWLLTITCRSFATPHFGIADYLKGEPAAARLPEVGAQPREPPAVHYTQSLLSLQQDWRGIVPDASTLNRPEVPKAIIKFLRVYPEAPGAVVLSTGLRADAEVNGKPVIFRTLAETAEAVSLFGWGNSYGGQ
jgi:hypothetical protein